jgi:serine/threonine-protein kinase
LLNRAIARGGMSIIHQAEHRYTGRTVALKQIDAEFEFDPELRDRLLLEARALELSRHPNVVQVIDAGLDEQGRAFLAMEMLDGRPLDGILTSRGKLSVADTVRIGVKIAEGLSAAHQRGVVHRDVKPSNVFIVRDESGLETVKLIDFGIAALRGSARGTTSSRKLTQRDSILGTPEYMAPEQLLMQENVDHRCDVYALAVLLYECLTGDVPFQGNYAEVLMRVSTTPPAPIHSVRHDVPSELAAAIARGLVRDPAQRWPTVIAFARALHKTVGPMEGTPIPLLDGSRGVVLTDADVELIEVAPPPLPAAAQRRRYARASFTTPVRIVQSTGQVVDGRSEDISEGGLLVLTSRPCAPDERAMVRFVPPGGSSVVTLPVVLRWIKDGRGRSAAGLEFIDAPEALKAMIRGFVAMGGGA